MTPQEIATSFEKSAAFIQRQLPETNIDAAVVLGSGFKDFVDCLENTISISYQDIPFFPKSQVQGHGQQVVFGKIGNKNILTFTGRFHYYQGIPITTTALPAWISSYLKIPRYILTNAAGGVNLSYQVGDLSIIKDHINITGLNPLRGVCLEGWENPFFDTSTLYNPALRQSFKLQIASQDMKVHQSTYCFLPGPNFETPAEIEMLRNLEVDLVGMSSVPESLVAHKLGMDVFGLSIVTNVYPQKGQPSQKVTHQEVLEATQKGAQNFNKIMKAWITSW